ncbi:MAG: hypothetical protein JNM27_06785 [Leptospirales bacterium]|nr:hypothetical protein [Leptospirales bacterium]
MQELAHTNLTPLATLSPFEDLDHWNFTGLLTGKSGIFHLSHVWQIQFLLQNHRILVIDCAIRFNAFFLAEEAHRLGLQSEAVLGSILVQRAFTPYQILDVITGILSKSHRPSPTTYFLLAPMKQFFDGDVSEEEGKFLLQKMLSVIRNIQAEGIPFLIVEKESYDHPSFAPAFQDLIQLANPLWQLTQRDGSYSLKARRLPEIQGQRSKAMDFHSPSSREPRIILERPDFSSSQSYRRIA